VYWTLRIAPVITETSSETDKQKMKEFEDADTLRQMLLVSSLDNSNIQLTATCLTGRSFWEKLTSVYEQSSDQRLSRVLESLFASNSLRSRYKTTFTEMVN